MTLLYAGQPGNAANIYVSFPGTIATNGTSDFSGVCSCIPTTLTLIDSVYGNCTLTYNPILQSWVGCRTVNYPGNANCPAGTIAIHYTIEGSNFPNNWQCIVQWPGHTLNGHACPLPGSDCTTPTGPSRQVSNAAAIVCAGANQWVFANSANSPWPGTGGATITVPFA